MNLLFIIASFFFGSIPYAFLYGKWVHGVDIREKGSGNSGATNSLRVFGKKAGLIVLVADVLKGFLPVYFAKVYLPEHVLYIGLAAILGHIFSPILKFKGGKGVATSLGVVLGINFYGALLCIAVFVLVVYLFRMVSLGSMLGGLAFMVYMLIIKPDQKELVILSIILAGLLIFTHRKNIMLIVKNQENKI
jgi:acyl phosphate:glycerol-3-phosphate acyltransferase